MYNSAAQILFLRDEGALVLLHVENQDGWGCGDNRDWVNPCVRIAATLVNCGLIDVLDGRSHFSDSADNTGPTEG